MTRSPDAPLTGRLSEVLGSLPSRLGLLLAIETEAPGVTGPRCPDLPIDVMVPGLVSVVLPTWNRAYVVTGAIDSVLAQSYAPIELIVVDDGSTDDTQKVLERYGSSVRYVRRENGGVVAARNTGLALVRGEYVALLDSDDQWFPWKIEAQVEILRRNPQAGMVWTDMSAVNEAGEVLARRYLREFYVAYRQVDLDSLLVDTGPASSYIQSLPTGVASAAVRTGTVFPQILYGNVVHTSTVLLRRSRVATIGGFDETLTGSGEDYDFHLRTCAAGPVAMLDAPSIYYRVGAADQLTSPAMQLLIARNDLLTVERWLGRRGEKGPLPQRAARQRLSWSHAWIAERQLLGGDRASARSHVLTSWKLRPGIDRRVVVLGLALLPSSVTRLARTVWWRVRYGRTPPPA